MKDISTVFEEQTDGFDADISGYITDPNTEINSLNFLLKNTNEHDFSNIVFSAMKKFCSNKCLVISNINVADEYQGQGIGKTILIDAISSSDSDVCILFCDKEQSQRDGFDLTTFYKRNGFSEVENGTGLMVYPIAFYESLIEEIAAQCLKSKLERMQDTPAPLHTRQRPSM
ncbi:GNAT family N-acetyltransferase [Aeromonas hydrophila]|uniref:GNAT family N-acetyltransferase n=1 Tax=Aeromonas hydrophila TaxID=644 RepID=UPI002B4974B4|nr:GNAT family N-acetyltransferase [Aeromonas hydrophila]